VVHQIQYSIIRRIGEEVPELNKVIWITPETVLSESDLPFATVEYIYHTNEIYGKRFDGKGTRYYFQIGVRGRNLAELLTLTEKVEKALVSEEIPLYDTTQPAPPPQIGTVRVTVPMSNQVLPENVNDTTGKYRCYLDATVFYISEL
jgi:hypothetical protein